MGSAWLQHSPSCSIEQPTGSPGLPTSADPTPWPPPGPDPCLQLLDLQKLGERIKMEEGLKASLAAETQRAAAAIQEVS